MRNARLQEVPQPLPGAQGVTEKPKRKPRKISAEDINPRYNWGRALPALGTMGVDFEERVDYRRLHKYRLGRARQALENSNLGALLVFDVNNIRYITSTKIGEWERDKLCRWALLSRDGEPILWDFGSAAKHHQLYNPWLDGTERARAGVSTLRGAFNPDAGIAQVQVDGGAPTQVDMYSPAATFQPVVFTANGLSDANHTLTIQATGTKNAASSAARVVVDALDGISRDIILRADGRTPPGKGDHVYVGIIPDHQHVFHAGTGARLS